MAKFILNTFKLLIIIAATCLSSGCLLLMVNGPEKFDKAQTHEQGKEKKTPAPKAKVYTMRGFLDVFSTGMYTLAKKIHDKFNMQATSISYLEEKKLSQFLIKDYQGSRVKTPIILIGHSYGADEQITVANRLNQAHVPVDLLITLDNTKKQTIPPNVRKFYNINSGESIFSGIIPWGCPLVAVSKQTRMVEVNLVKDKGLRKVNHFNIDKLPEVQGYITDIIQTSQK